MKPHRLYFWPRWWSGLATAVALSLSLLAAAEDVAWVFNSEPAGRVDQSGTAAIGTRLVTAALQGETTGWTFAYWKINGQRQADANGVALPAAAFTLNAATTATAVYLPSAQDSDGDGLPDWYEWQQFGGLSKTGAGDEDADGIPNATEALRGYSARLPDVLWDGGIAARRSTKLMFVSAGDASYVFNSEPAGRVEQSGTAAIGTRLVTPALQGETTGWTFAYWKINGQRQADASGVALPAAAFTLNAATTATAVYLPSAQDSDGDGLPDWYEWQQFGGLSKTGAGDEDADGIPNATETLRGYSARLPDILWDGGIAARRSTKILFVSAGDASYVFNSEPAGRVEQSGTAAIGTRLVTPALQGERTGWTFAYWKINGQRQADASGVALPSAAFTLNAATTATAVYLPSAQDSDGDGLPDWYEWQQFGGLSKTGAGDDDADGIPNATEELRGYSARLPDVLWDGGIAARCSTKLVFVAPAAPVISVAPVAVTAGSGDAAAFSVTVGAAGLYTFQWMKNGSPIAGATNQTLAFASVTTADAGNYSVAVSGAGGTTATSPVALTVMRYAPNITIHPVGQTVKSDESVTFTVVASGTAPFNYQWRKSGVAVSGATNASFTITNAQPSDSGSYDVVVSNGVSPDAISNPAALNVIPTGVAAAHAMASYAIGASGGTATIANSFTYPGTTTNLQWSVLLPTGWSLASSDAATADVKPAVGATGLLEWRWTLLPASPVTFSYSLNIPVGDTAPHPLSALVAFRYAGTTISMTAKVEPLTVGPYHSADTNRDNRLSVFELTRAIELYNTRNGTVRTGCYRVDASGEDGFAPEPARAGSAVVALMANHSADTTRDGKLSLIELTRVIELYNTRDGTVRTGAYHAQAGTEDGFAPGP